MLKIERVQIDFEDQRSSEFQEVYKTISAMDPEDQIRVGPMKRNEANSLQTSITGFCNRKGWKVRTIIRDINANPVTNSEETYVYVLVVSK